MKTLRPSLFAASTSTLRHASRVLPSALLLALLTSCCKSDLESNGVIRSGSNCHVSHSGPGVCVALAVPKLLLLLLA